MTPKPRAYYDEKLRRLADHDLRIFKRLPLSEITEVKNIHLIGVCGTAMGSLAGLLVAAGYHVSGSDEGCYPPMDKQIAALGIHFYEGFHPDHLSLADLVIVGNFSGPNNPETAFAREKGIPTFSMAEALEYFFIKNPSSKLGARKSLVVAGTHGKTTTSGLLAHVFRSAGEDPTYLIGGVLKNYGETYHYGKGETVIIEGDEYDTAYFDKSPKFLHYHPTSVIITSLEFDHIDIYDDMEDYTQAFKFLTSLIPEDGNLILWGDDEKVRALANSTKRNIYFYGLKEGNNVTAKNIKIGKDSQEFDLYVNDKELGRVETTLYGKHNLLNTLAVAAMALSNGLTFQKLREGLKSFQGMKRRQETVGEINGITIVDDFAHHPTAVRETIASVKEKFGNRRLVVFFEPRSNTSRRKIFEEDYGKAFDQADKVYLSVPPLRHNDTPADFINEERVVHLINEQAKDLQKATFYKNANELLESALPHLQKGDVILIMSNGAFDGIQEKLLKAVI